MFKDLCSRDLVAIIVIIGAFILKFNGSDGIVSIALISVVAFYFGLKLPSTPQDYLASLAKKDNKKEASVE